MKTVEVGGQQAVQSTTEIRDRKAGTADNAFAALLDGELASGSNADAVGALGLGNVDAVTRSEPSVLSTASSAEYSGVADAIDSQLVRLEEVGTALQNENVDLRAVDAALTQVGEEAKGLDSSLETLPQDHPLRQIGDELNVLTYVESVKWRRGDYL